MNTTNHAVDNYTKPKRRKLKIIVLIIILLILGVGVWLGILVYRTLAKVTSLSGGNNPLLGLFSSNAAIKGQSDGRTNILLMGMGGASHPGGNLTDSIMVVSIDWNSKKMAMISVPRDLWVNIPGHGYAKINEAYSTGEQNKASGGGTKVASDIISSVLGVPIHYTVTMDFDGFKEIINTVGGIDVNVEKALNDPYYPAPDMIRYDPFSISAGEHHMNGDIALKYARSRETTSDFDRAHRQQLVLAATKQKVLSVGVLANPAKINSMLSSVGNHVRTNATVAEIKSLWEGIKDINMSNSISYVFDTSADSPLVSSTSSGGAYIIIPKKGMGNYADLQAIAKNIFTTGGTSVKIEVLNGSGKTGAGTDASKEITDAGYTVDNVSTTTKTATSVVYNCSGESSQTIAQKIATLLKAEVQSKTSCGNYNLSVVVGQNFTSN